MWKKVVGAAFGVAVGVSAAVGDEVTAEYTGPSDGSSVALAGTFNQMGQSFEAAVGGSVTTIELWLSSNGDMPANLKLALWEADAEGLPIGFPDGTPLGEAQLAIDLPDMFDWRVFDFSGLGLELDAGADYAITLSSGPADGGYKWGTTTGDPYEPGEGLIRFAGGPIVPMADEFIVGQRDTLFRVSVDTGEPACPCDFDGMGPALPDGADFNAFLSAFFAGDPPADFDGMGPALPDGADFNAFLDCFFNPPASCA